jgi:hypothetical protein
MGRTEKGTTAGIRALATPLLGTVLLLGIGACSSTKATGGDPRADAAPSEENSPEVIEILEKHIDAIGGREAQLSIKTSESEYQFQLVDSGNDSKVQGTIYEIRDRTSGRFYSRTTDPHGTVELGYNGIRAWDKTPLHQGYLLSSDPQFRELIQKRPEIHEYKETGQKFTRARNEMVGGNECIVLKGRSRGLDRDGRERAFSVRYYFDPQTYLLHRIVAESQIRQTIDFDDFREVDGTKVPFLKATRNPRVKFVWYLKSLKYNVEIDPERFEYEPKSKAAGSK